MVVIDLVDEVNQATLKVVFNYDGMTISERGLTSVCKNGQWLIDDIMAYTRCRAEFEYIKNNVSPRGKNDLIVIYPSVLEMFLKTYKSSDVLNNHKSVDEIGLTGWKDMEKAQYLSLEFNRRICFYNNTQYLDPSAILEGSHWSYMMIEVIKVAGGMNLKITNYKWDSSKKQINRKANQLSAE